MKKLVAVLAGITILFTSINVSAEDNTVIDHSQYVEIESGDIIDIEVISTSHFNAACNLSNDVLYATRISRDHTYEETLYVDFSADELIHEYSDGSIVTEKLSDIVTISSVIPSPDDQLLAETVPAAVSLSDTDYITNEPLSVDSAGNQAVLSGVSSYSGYQAMGSRGGYYYAPSTYGYLQRKNAGVVGTYYAHKFDFTAGTKIGTAASIISAFVSSSYGITLAVSVATAILGMVIDTVTYDWSTTFEVKRYRWDYLVRLNSNSGTIIFNTYRTKDYWKGYSENTGAVYHEYRGTAYDDGFLHSNSDMIKSAIDAYIAG